ncbi:GntR family transcriptional regulator [Neoaquamicrobium sediminum]|uniref:GntR family transcriptional regulator n=2 Tax=Neoaquamicrobium sediminum TaxID=1849104 RepID=UPI0036170DFC
MTQASIYLSKADLARRHIEDLIISRAVKPGDRITTREISEALGISETPIREAIRSLASEGWLEVQMHVGAVVASAGREQLREIYALRAMIGSLAIELGASSYDARRMAQIDANIDAATLAVEAQDAVRYIQLNHEFHTLLNDTPHSQWCLRMLMNLSALSSAHSGFKVIAGRMADSLAEHKSIRDALKAGEFESAAALVRLHENAAYEAITRELQSDNPAQTKNAG